MNTEPTLHAGPSDGSRESVQRLLIEALAKGGGRATLKEILAHAPMAADQRSLMELLLSLDHGESGDSEPEASRGAQLGDEPTPAAQTIGALKQELADLREVNDTVAAALGACRVCWGGDAACPACDGNGGAGSTKPDPALFRELVAPAMRRVRSLEGRGSRPGSRRPRVGGSTEWRHSHEW